MNKRYSPNRTLIVEVLSPSTEAYDRARKFEHYRSLALLLRQYLLVASEGLEIELRTQQIDGKWLLSFATKVEDVIDLEIGRRAPVTLGNLLRRAISVVRY